MVWMTGRVQEDQRPKSENITVGVPFVYYKDGKPYCKKTNKRLYSCKVNFKKYFKNRKNK